jgi:6-phosphogluconate dehydrogenase
MRIYTVADMQVERYEQWKQVVKLAVDAGVATPGMASSLTYFETYRRGSMAANLVQAQRDFFGSHTYERNDGKEGSFHTVWDPNFGSKDSITTSGYNN